MTKYVLNSGGAKRHHDLKRKFHEEVIAGLNKSPKVILCNFAQGREYWDVKFESYAESIRADMPEDVDPSFELAMPDIFADQCKRADVLYFHGGDNDLLFYWMRKFDYVDLFSGKVVATSSASSCMLAESCWTCDWRTCQDGFGVLPVKFIPHFESDFGNNDPRGPIDWTQAYDELKAHGKQELQILALKEGEYRVFET